LRGGVKIYVREITREDLGICNFPGSRRIAWVRTASEELHSKHIQNELRILPRPGRTGSAVGKSLHTADFHSAQVQQQSDPQLANVVAEGRGNMPAFGTRLSKSQIDALVRYIRTLGSAK
jgi:Cytochrome C oxidase, cbb3-type, subunit III